MKIFKPIFEWKNELREMHSSYLEASDFNFYILTFLFVYVI